MRGCPSFEIKGEDLMGAIAAEATWHGVKQKIGDAGAQGAGSTPAAKYAAMLQVRDQIVGPDGTWNRRGGGQNSVELMLTALERVTKATRDEVSEMWESWTPEAREAMQYEPEVAKAIAAIRAEAAMKKAKPVEGFDPKAALAQLKAMSGPGKDAKRVPHQKAA